MHATLAACAGTTQRSCWLFDPCNGGVPAAARFRLTLEATFAAWSQGGLTGRGSDRPVIFQSCRQSCHCFLSVPLAPLRSNRGKRLHMQRYSGASGTIATASWYASQGHLAFTWQTLLSQSPAPTSGQSRQTAQHSMGIIRQLVHEQGLCAAWASHCMRMGTADILAGYQML